MNCPNCNNPLEPGQKFCQQCGTPVAPVQMDTERTVAADFDEIPAAPQQPEAPAQPSAWAQQPAQPEYQQPAQPEYQQPAQPEYQQPAQPEYKQPAQQQNAPQWPEGSSVASAWQQPANNYQQQYQNYQQPSQYGSSQSAPYGFNNPQYGGTTTATKSKRPVIIIIVAAVLVVGIVLGLVFGIKGCAGGKHQIKNEKGIVLADDSAIDTGDSAAEAKLKAYIDKSNISASMNSYMGSYGTGKVYAKGNAVVSEMNLYMTVPEDQKAQFVASVESSLGDQSQTLANGRAQTGVNNMVLVYAVVDSSGTRVYSKVVK